MSEKASWKNMCKKKYVMYLRMCACVNPIWRRKMAPLSKRFELPFLRNQRIIEPHPLEISKSMSNFDINEKKKSRGTFWGFSLSYHLKKTCNVLLSLKCADKTLWPYLYRKLYSTFVVTLIFNILQNENYDCNYGLTQVLWSGRINIFDISVSSVTALKPYSGVSC